MVKDECNLSHSGFRVRLLLCEMFLTNLVLKIINIKKIARIKVKTPSPFLAARHEDLISITSTTKTL